MLTCLIADKAQKAEPRWASFLPATAALAGLLALQGCGPADSRQGSEKALGDYQQALSTRDAVRLERAWRMPADDQRRMRELLSSTHRLSVVLSAPVVAEERGGTVVEFTQTLKTDWGTVGPTAMRANLRADANGWTLEGVRQREVDEPATLASFMAEPAAGPTSESNLLQPPQPTASGEVSAPAPRGSSPTVLASDSPRVQPDPSASAEGTAGRGAKVIGVQIAAEDTGAETVPGGAAPPRRGVRTARAITPAKQPAAATQPTSTEDEEAALAVLSEYQAAYERRDLERLSEVWKMDPFERELMQQIFSGNDSLKVSIREQGIAAVGDEIAVDFDQAVARTSVKRARVPLHASLVKRPGGEWEIVALEPRDTPANGPSGGYTTSSSAQASDSEASETKAILTSLREYEQAFEAHDLERLQRVWVLNPLERKSIQDLFSEPATGRIRVRATNIAIRDDKATVDFEQSFESSTGGYSHALAAESLRARLARAPDGTFVIVSISNRK